MQELAAKAIEKTSNQNMPHHKYTPFSSTHPPKHLVLI